MKQTPLQRRAEHRNRNKTMVDMNLVSLIDVFTILIFFLLSNTGAVETLASPRAVKLPESAAEKAPRETVLVVVTGSEVVEVFARGAVRIDPRWSEIGDIDTAVVTLVHANGCLTAIDNSRRAAYGYDQRVEAFGSEGMAASENPPAHTGVMLTAAGGRRSPLPYFFLERYMASYELEWEAFIDALRRGVAPPVGARDARAPLVIGLAAWQSLREGHPVALAVGASR